MIKQLVSRCVNAQNVINELYNENNPFRISEIDKLYLESILENIQNGYKPMCYEEAKAALNNTKLTDSQKRLFTNAYYAPTASKRMSGVCQNISELKSLLSQGIVIRKHSELPRVGKGYNLDYCKMEEELNGAQKLVAEIITGDNFLDSLYKQLCSKSANPIYFNFYKKKWLAFHEYCTTPTKMTNRTPLEQMALKFVYLLPEHIYANILNNSFSDDALLASLLETLMGKKGKSITVLEGLMMNFYKYAVSYKALMHDDGYEWNDNHIADNPQDGQEDVFDLALSLGKTETADLIRNGIMDYLDDHIKFKSRQDYLYGLVPIIHDNIFSDEPFMSKRELMLNKVSTMKFRGGLSESQSGQYRQLQKAGEWYITYLSSPKTREIIDQSIYGKRLFVNPLCFENKGLSKKFKRLFDGAVQDIANVRNGNPYVLAAEEISKDPDKFTSSLSILADQAESNTDRNEINRFIGEFTKITRQQIGAWDNVRQCLFKRYITIFDALNIIGFFGRGTIGRMIADIKRLEKSLLRMAKSLMSSQTGELVMKYKKKDGSPVSISFSEGDLEKVMENIHFGSTMKRTMQGQVLYEGNCSPLRTPMKPSGHTNVYIFRSGFLWDFKVGITAHLLSLLDEKERDKILKEKFNIADEEYLKVKKSGFNSAFDNYINSVNKLISDIDLMSITGTVSKRKLAIRKTCVDRFIAERRAA